MNNVFKAISLFETSDSTVTPDPEFPDSTVTPDPEFPDSIVTPDPEFPDSIVTPDPEFPDSIVTPDPEFPDSIVTPDPEFPDSIVTPDPEFPDSIGISNTPETAYTVADAHQLIDAGKDLTTEVYIKGIITKIDEINTNYGNATYYISGTDTVGGPLKVYRGFYFDGAKFTQADQIKVGDELIIYGQLSDFYGTHQVNMYSSIYSLNGHTAKDISNSPETAYTVAEAHQLIDAGEGLNTEVYIKGIITKIDEISTDHGNATYYISGTDSVDAPLEVYHGFYFDGTKFTQTDQIKVGDEIVILGQLYVFNGEHQIKSGSSIYSLNGSTEAPAPSVDISNTPETAYTVAEAIELIQAGEGLATPVYVKGTITTIVTVSPDYGNATYYINDTYSEEGQLQVFRGLYLDQSEFTSEDQIQPNYQVVVYGTLKLFNGNPEISDSYIHSLEKPELQEPEFAWSANRFTVDLNAADEVTYPTLTNNSTGKVSYISSDYSVAIIDSIGEIIPVGVGTTTITAHVTATAIHSAASASYTLEVFDSSLPQQPMALVSVKDSIYYMMLNTNATSDGQLDAKEVTVFRGSVVTENRNLCGWYVDRTNGTIISTDSTRYVAYDNGTLKLDSNPYYWTYTTDNLWQTTVDSEPKAIGLETATADNSQHAFGIYPVTEIENDINLAPIVMPILEGYTREVTAGNYGTICLPYTISAGSYDGVEFFSIAGKIMKDNETTGIVLEKVDSLTAGKAYVFNATSNRLVTVYCGEAVESPVEDNNGLIGSFTDKTIPEGMYLLTDNTLKSSDTTDGNIAANCAYFDLNQMGVYNGTVEENQPLISIESGNNDNPADVVGIAVERTDLVDVYTLSGVQIRSQVTISEATKGLSKGLYIVNGKKVIVK